MTDALEFLAIAESLARGAGDIALRGRRNDATGGVAGDTKSSRTDLVTEHDRAAEAHVVEGLRRLRPDDAIVGEEGTDHPGTSGYAWYIDPIDGTTNFVYDQPAWACSVAVAHGDEMLAGAVYAPALGELYAAARDHGATLDGRPIRVTGLTDPALALVGTGFGYRSETRRAQANELVEVIAAVRDVRRLGSAAFDLCMVACGRLDAYYERHLSPWDSAAGELIAREAGAVSSDFTGGPARPDEMLVATPGIHAALVELLRPA